MQNKVCESLGIKYPIIQGAMQWVSDYALVSAVSEAGGLGVLATADKSGAYIREQIRKTREKTKKPFAVNITILSKTSREVFEVALEEKVPFLVMTAGNPAPFVPLIKEAGIPFISLVATVKQAAKMEQMGACLIVVEGQEGGGHIGEMTTMALVPQAVDAVSIPVVAAGGIGDGRGMAAAFALGAQGIQMGTAFLASRECTVHQNFKDVIVASTSGDVVVTGRQVNNAVRCIDNDLTRAFKALDEKKADTTEYADLGRGTAYKASQEGDVVLGSVMAGQIVGLVQSEESVADIIGHVIKKYNEVVGKLPLV